MGLRSLAISSALTFVLVSCSGGDSPTDPVKPPTPVATTVTLSAPTVSLSSLGATQQLTATVKDQTGAVMSSATVTWASSNQLVATISSSGLVTAVANGAATITATSGIATGTAAVTIQQQASSLSLSPSTKSFASLGDTARLVATVKDANGQSLAGATVTWVSSNLLVATVSTSGLVTSVANGTATITATSGSAAAAAAVAVQQVATSLVLSPASVTFSSLGATQQLTSTVRDSRSQTISNATVTWVSSSAQVATVSSTGLVTAIASGAATITATSGSATGTASVTVQPVATVSISPTSLTLDVGQTATITATVRDASGNAMADKTVTWATSDASVVGGTVNGNTATLVAAGAGSASVTATVDGIVGTLPVTVRTTAPKPVASVVVTPSTVTLVVGAKVILIATLRDAQGNVLTGRTVSWTSSNLQVANGTVSGNTVEVTGGTVGTATVFATSEGVSGSSVVTVISSGGGGGVSLTCAGVAGGVILAQDGTYLGKLSNRFDTQSILNTFGSYGSQFSSTSIYNQFSQYGSQFAPYSAYNEFSTKPPILYVNNAAVAYISKNTFKTPRIDPDVLKACTFP